jgi:hypothetical protein
MEHISICVSADDADLWIQNMNMVKKNTEAVLESSEEGD